MMRTPRLPLGSVLVLLLAGLTSAAAAAVPAAAPRGGGWGLGRTATPIKHLVVIFQENETFDHYFGTHPDALNPPGPPGARFTPRPPPSEDVAAYVSESISSALYRYQAAILMHGPVEAVAQRSSPAAGRLEAVDRATCILHTGSNSLGELALYVAVKGFDFEVLHPPELIPVLRALSDRLRDAADASTTLG
jgi:hypothetical protein